MNPQDENSFFDIKTLLAVATVVVFWFLWDAHMKNQYPMAYKKEVQVKSGQAQKDSLNGADSVNGGAKVGSKGLGESKSRRALKTTKNREAFHSFEDDNWSFSISSKGMGIEAISLKDYTDRQGKLVQLASNKNSRAFETQLKKADEYLYFSVQRIKPHIFRGKAKFKKLEIIKTLTIDSKNFLVESHVVVKNIGPQFEGLSTYLSEKEDKTIEEPSMFSPTLSHQELFVSYENDFERFSFADVKEGSGQLKNVHGVSLGAQYFTLALVNRSNTLPSINYFFDASSDSVIARLDHKMLSNNPSFEVKYIFYAGPKDLKKLAYIDQKMTDVVDFGWFGSIAHWLLALLSFLHGIVGNWGVAIIILTFIVRLVLLPLNIISYKSMRKMQELQPIIKEVRAKYKDEPQRMNKEVMALMKENKANPMAGCLPMFLQFPIFIALYRVLGMSIELYQVPFAFWITDLSLKDDLYILPILMGIAMFFQMKLTPSVGDATQKKIMMFMPVMFTFFMINLPSGLNLYMFTTTLFGVAQHYLFMRKTVPN